MLDEVDTLHVERNTFSRDELFSYTRYIAIICIDRPEHYLGLAWQEKYKPCLHSD
jgi:hypothetical protein